MVICLEWITVLRFFLTAQIDSKHHVQKEHSKVYRTNNVYNRFMCNKMSKALNNELA